jgi:prepilin-type N-terminal cleavage/methylation domain-containing protein
MRLRLTATPTPHAAESGFSLAEMLVSVAIITLLMSAVFTFMGQAQKRYQGSAVIAEANQGARAALEVMAQEIGQAGYNPSFTNNKTASNAITASAMAQCIPLSDISMINPGDWVSVDTGANNELVEVLSTSAISASPCSTSNQIEGVFQLNHPTTPFPVMSYKMPYPTGILQGTGASNDHTLEFYGDINQDGTINYVVYTLYAAAGAPTVTINGSIYTLYTLYRSITPVTFNSGATNNSASPMVQNVLYNMTTQGGPSGQPIFSYPSTFALSIVPNTVTVVGTVVINLSVAINPQNLETGVVQWYTMATQIRPLNLAASVSVDTAGGGKFLPPQPLGLPMAIPSNYYQ